MKIFKILQTRKKHKKSVSNGCENLQPSALHEIYNYIFFPSKCYFIFLRGCEIIIKVFYFDRESHKVPFLA